MAKHKVIRALQYLNDHHMARIIVLAGPGVVLNKLAQSIGAPQSVQLVTSLILGIGIVLYVAWNFFYKRAVGVEEVSEVDSETSHVEGEAVLIPGQVHVALMRELIEMCGGDAAKALQLVETEVRVNPNVSYLAAIELAHRRLELSA
jgi:hypothetical protein